MTAIAALFNVPSNEGEFNTWSFAHAAHHHDIIRVIYQDTQIQLPEYVLDPFDPNNPNVWLDQHQQMHQGMDNILGIAGYDLLDVDMSDPNDFAGWIFLNANEHFQAAQILGIG